MYNLIFEIINSTLAQKASGKFILSNGLKICWGICSTDNVNGYIRQKYITFPITYTSAPTVIATKLVSNSSIECAATVGVGTTTTTQTVVKAMNEGSILADTNIKINWIAIGY